MHHPGAKACRGNDEACLKETPPFRDGAQARGPESGDSPMCNCTSQFDAPHRSAMTEALAV
jgi:hypothetical protein